MPVAFKLSGTSFNQDFIKTLQINQPVELETQDHINDSDSDVEDLDGRNPDPPIKCFSGDPPSLIGYVPKEHKKRVKELIKDKKTFKIYRLNTYKDNPIIGVRIKSV